MPATSAAAGRPAIAASRAGPYCRPCSAPGPSWGCSMCAGHRGGVLRDSVGARVCGADTRGKGQAMSEHAGGALPPSAVLDAAAAPAQDSGTPRWSPWRAVVGFGVVSLLADAVYEG